uniref:DUF148 domain-containing protein n=1 Tax=Meloidogyne hapla TaxID=6305 RepID=A0A1I8BDF5_MELHA
MKIKKIVFILIVLFGDINGATKTNENVEKREDSEIKKLIKDFHEMLKSNEWNKVKVYKKGIQEQFNLRSEEIKEFSEWDEKVGNLNEKFSKWTGEIKEKIKKESPQLSDKEIKELPIEWNDEIKNKLIDFKEIFLEWYNKEAKGFNEISKYLNPDEFEIWIGGVEKQMKESNKNLNWLEQNFLELINESVSEMSSWWNKWVEKNIKKVKENHWNEKLKKTFVKLPIELLKEFPNWEETNTYTELTEKQKSNNSDNFIECLNKFIYGNEKLQELKNIEEEINEAYSVINPTSRIRQKEEQDSNGARL